VTRFVELAVAAGQCTGDREGRPVLHDRTGERAKLVERLTDAGVNADSGVTAEGIHARRTGDDVDDAGLAVDSVEHACGPRSTSMRSMSNRRWFWDRKAPKGTPSI